MARRPDLLHPSAAATDPGEWVVEPATRADAGELLTLQLACWVGEAVANDDLGIPALHEGVAEVTTALEQWRVDVVRLGGRLVASVRGRLDDGVWQIGRLMVAPDLQGRGLGRLLLDHVQAVAPDAATTYRLFTGKHSHANLRMYARAGFRVVETLDGASGPVVLSKARDSVR